MGAILLGEFGAIATSVPGVSFCELLPESARLLHKFAVIRSVFSTKTLNRFQRHWRRLRARTTPTRKVW